jgi:hypothetical protein
LVDQYYRSNPNLIIAHPTREDDGGHLRRASLTAEDLEKSPEPAAIAVQTDASEALCPFSVQKPSGIAHSGSK